MSYVTRILTQLPFGNIIGGPMKAAIEAQALAAKSTIDFIQTVGFKKQSGDQLFPVMNNNEQEGGDFGEVRNITFSYKTMDSATNSEKTVELTVPILTVVPIPYLRIDEMTIDFTAKITEEFQNSNTSQTDTSLAANMSSSWKSWWSPVSVSFNASISNKSSSSASSSSRYQTESTMNVHVRAVQDSMPAGLAKVLSILETSAIRNTA